MKLKYLAESLLLCTEIIMALFLYYKYIRFLVVQKEYFGALLLSLLVLHGIGLIFRFLNSTLKMNERRIKEGARKMKKGVDM